jgi:hypothetical protein
MHGAFPPGLADTPTGPGLCAVLEPIELSAVPDRDLMAVLAGQSRQLAYQQARVWATMAEAARRDPMLGGKRWTPMEMFESAVDEIRAELRLTRRSARRELTHADLVSEVPRVAAALERGELDRGRAIVLAEGCADLAAEHATELLDRLLPDAGTVTSTGLAERVRRVAIALDPDWAKRRYTEAVRERRVVGYLNDDGSATVSGQNLPADQAAAACARVDALACSAKRSGAGGPIDHLRAELFLGLLDGRFSGLPEAAIVAELMRLFPPTAAPRSAQPTEPAQPVEPEQPEQSVEPEQPEQPASPTQPAQRGIAATVAPPGTVRGIAVRVGLGTLLGLDEQPGEIPGWGPVTAPVARDIVARQQRAEWRFAIVDGDGRLIFDGITRRRPLVTGAASVETSTEAQGGIVELHVPAALLDRNDVPAEWAVVLADLAARNKAQHRPPQDPAARFPGRPQRRRTQLLFQRCVFPGCRRPAAECDVDHRRDHARGGHTDDANLEPSCRHDHMNKTVRGWRLIRSGQHTFTWISPLGRRHVVQVPPITAPLPAPIPRAAAQHDLPVGPPPGPRDDETPTFAPRTRRGRPLTPAQTTEPAASAATESDPDPPPF